MLRRSEKNQNNNNYSNNNDNNNDDDKKTNHTLSFTKSVDYKISSSNVLFALRGVPDKAFKPKQKTLLNEPDSLHFAFC